MRVIVADHPLISHKLTTLRDKRTDSPTFRRLVDELVTLLAYEATRDVRVEEVDVETPVTTARGRASITRQVPPSEPSVTFSSSGELSRVLISSGRLSRSPWTTT